MDNVIRAFIAITISEEIRANLHSVQNLIRQIKKQEKAKISIPKAENIHLTLRFLGDISEDLIPSIDEILTEKLRNVDSFNLKILGTGAFPHLKKPKIIWAGIKKSEQLQNVAKIVNDSISTLPIRDELKPFRPHLTLARVKDAKYNSLATALKSYFSYSFGQQTVKEIILYKSELDPRGAIYTPIEKWNLI